MVVPAPKDDLTTPEQNSNPHTLSVFDKPKDMTTTCFEPRNEPFQHRPLDATKSEIRLCKVLPQSQEPRDNFIRCEIAHYDLDNCSKSLGQSESSGRSPTKFTYIAVSYCWGDYKPSHTILVDGRTFMIRANLFQFLSAMQDAKEHGTLFWIDQLGIDQQNTAERNHQVHLMSSIYSQAEAVYAWLGEAETYSALAFPILEEYASDEDEFHTAKSFINKRTDDEVLGFIELFTRPYWTRIWIVQEIYLAHKLFLLCGREKFLEQHIQRRYYSWIAAAIVCSKHYKLLDAVDLRPLYPLPRILYDSLELLDGRYEKQYTRPDMLLDSLVWSTMKNCTRYSSDPRDMVYGIQACVCQEERVNADYSKTAQQVFYELMVEFVNQGQDLAALVILGVIAQLRNGMGLRDIPEDDLQLIFQNWEDLSKDPFSELT